MTTRTIRRPIQCLCPHCYRGHVYRYGGKHVCSECGGTSNVVRWVNEVVHVDMSALSSDYAASAVDMGAAE